jgi:probable rRNA maturation factor
MSIILSHTARSFPELPYEAMKNDVLGKHYTLSLTFVGKTRALMLNKKYRNATYVPNVLSFPLDTAHGEIYITPHVAKHEAHKFDMTPNGYMGFLFIHGLLHLKGHLHGDTMEKAEKKYVAKYSLK